MTIGCAVSAELDGARHRDKAQRQNIARRWRTEPRVLGLVAASGLSNLCSEMPVIRPWLTVAGGKVSPCEARARRLLDVIGGKQKWSG